MEVWKNGSMINTGHVTYPETCLLTIKNKHVKKDTCFLIIYDDDDKTVQDFSCPNKFYVEYSHLFVEVNLEYGQFTDQTTWYKFKFDMTVGSNFSCNKKWIDKFINHLAMCIWLNTADKYEEIASQIREAKDKEE